MEKYSVQLHLERSPVFFDRSFLQGCIDPSIIFRTVTPLLYLFLFLMLLNCGIYAIAWQMVMKKFDLSTAYANKSVYLIWSQLWAVLIFKESLSISNIIGMLVVFLSNGGVHDE